MVRKTIKQLDQSSIVSDDSSLLYQDSETTKQIQMSDFKENIVVYGEEPTNKNKNLIWIGE